MMPPVVVNMKYRILLTHLLIHYCRFMLCPSVLLMARKSASSTFAMKKRSQSEVQFRAVTNLKYFVFAIMNGYVAKLSSLG